MSQFKITQLTPEQEALIPLYREKWRELMLSTEPIDHQKATEAIKAAYAVVGKLEPVIIFCSSPYTGLLALIPMDQVRDKLGRELHVQLQIVLTLQLADQLREQLSRQLIEQLKSQLSEPLEELEEQIFWQLCVQLRVQILETQQTKQFCEYIAPELWACDGSWYDFCISVLNCPHNQSKWEAFQSLVNHCGWIFPYEDIVVVCDRPRKLSFDSEDCLHAEGEPAIQFADGFSVCSYHGVRLPEKYGKLHPNQWRSQWLLEEDNAELRRVLIQGIGYSQICQELQAVELDLWQEYALLKIDADVDIEPIYLLKMTCPSTGFIHVLRVPPDMHSAREAIRWVNWETDPEEFSIQT